MRCTFCGLQPRKKLPLALLNENRSPKGCTELAVDWENVTAILDGICCFFFFGDQLFLQASECKCKCNYAASK